jgi:hypothetical protein
VLQWHIRTYVRLVLSFEIQNSEYRPVMCVPCRSPALTLKFVPVLILQYIANCVYLRVSSYCSLYVQFDRMQRFCLQHVGRALRFYMLHSLTHAFTPSAPFASPFRHFVLHVLPSPSFHSPCVPKYSVIQQSDYANLHFFTPQ